MERREARAGSSDLGRTLASYLFIRSHSAPIYLTDHPTFLSLVMGRVVPGVPNVVVLFFLVAAVAAVVLNRTVPGRRRGSRAHRSSNP